METNSFLEKEALDSYLQYAVHVLKRSIPDVRDGLKIVQRRIIYSMSNNKLFFEGKFVKSIKIVGDVLGRFHPHGDLPVYEALVRMAQPFNMRYPLIASQGNFGSIDGDNAADARYTEAKLSLISSFLSKDIEKDCIDMTFNFDNTELEPLVLPSFLPNILLNGSHGIAVGMMSIMPPHNLNDSLEAVISYIKNNNISSKELGDIIKGPDFPTGGILFKEGISDYYEKGYGSIICKGRTIIQENLIIITEIPFGVKKTTILEEINELRKKFSNQIGSVKDESDRFGTRICIYTRKNIQDIEKKIFRYTSLQKKIFFNSLVMLGEKAIRMNLKEIIKSYVDFQDKTLKRSLRFDIDKIKKRLSFLYLLEFASQNIQEIIQILKHDTNTEIFKYFYNFNFNKQEIEKILSIPISRFSRIEKDKIIEEKNSLNEKLEDLNKLFSEKSLRMQYLIQRMNNIQQTTEEKRKTEITDESSVINMSLVDDHKIYVCILKNRFFCKMYMNDLKIKGIKQAPTKLSSIYGDIQDMFVSSEKSNFAVFSNLGRIFRIKPFSELNFLNDSMIDLFDLGEKMLDGEKIVTYTNLSNTGYIIFGTERGKIIYMKQSILSNTRDGTRIVKLRNKDNLSCCTIVEDETFDNIVLINDKGLAANFNLSKIRILNKNTSGVKGIKLQEKDRLISVLATRSKDVIYVFSEKGFAKGIRTTDLRQSISRGNKGTKIINLSEDDKINSVVCSENSEFTFLCPQNIIYRNNIKDLRIHSRYSKGRNILSKHSKNIINVLI